MSDELLEQIRKNENIEAPPSLRITEDTTNSEDAVSVRDETSDPIDITRGRGRGKRNARRIAISIVDGKIDLSRNNDAQVTLLADAFAKSPEVQQKLAPLAVIAEPVSLDLCMAIYDGVAGIERLVAINVGHYPPPVALAAFKFTKEQKEALAKPTQAVLSKYIPTSYLAYGPEAQLALTLFGVIQQQIETSKHLLEQWKKTHFANGPNGGLSDVPAASEVQ